MGTSQAIAVIAATICLCLICRLIYRSSGPSRISQAVIYGDLTTLRSLLATSTDSQKCDALFSAIFHRRDDELGLVLDAHPDLTRPLKWGGAALHIAARYGTSHALGCLLDLNVDVDQDCSGTPLYWAADAGRDDVVERLISAGADANAVKLELLGESGFKPNRNTPDDYDRIADRIRLARNAI